MITEILRSALSVLGADGFDDTLGLASRIGPARRIAVLLVDGMGYHLLPRSPEIAAVAAHAEVDELTCTMPSTTPTSLVSLCTGAAPGAHGILGFTLNVPGTDRVLTHIFWRDDPDPSTWQPVPTVFERASVPTSVVLPAAFEHSGLTRAAYRGAAYVGLGDADDLAAALLRELRGDARLVYGYTSRVDTAAHLHGIASPEWVAAMRWTATLIEHMVEALPPDTALLVTADHGGLDIPAAGRFDLGTDPRLSAGVRVVAGEPRLRYLHVVDGARSDVVAAWSGVLGGAADVLTREEAVASGLFGDVAPAHLARIGDVVVICTGVSAVLATGYEPPEVARLIGFHGARTPAETAIPLLSFVAS